MRSVSGFSQPWPRRSPKIKNKNKYKYGLWKHSEEQTALCDGRSGLLKWPVSSFNASQNNFLISEQNETCQVFSLLRAEFEVISWAADHRVPMFLAGSRYWCHSLVEFPVQDIGHEEEEERTEMNRGWREGGSRMEVVHGRRA